MIALDDAHQALPLADVLAEGGSGVIDVTFRTAASVDAIRHIAQHRPDILVGAGTVQDAAQADAAKTAGARFALSPGIDRAVLAHAAQIGLPFAPGIMTPSDLKIGQVLSGLHSKRSEHVEEYRPTPSAHRDRL